MATGTLKRWNARGFSFLAMDDKSRDTYIHIKAYKASGLSGEPEEGQRFQFDIEQGDRGPRAVNIRPA